MTDTERIRRWFEIAHREDRVHPHLAIHLKDAALRCETQMFVLARIRASLLEWMQMHEVGKMATLAEYDINKRAAVIVDEIDELLCPPSPAC